MCRRHTSRLSPLRITDSTNLMVGIGNLHHPDINHGATAAIPPLLSILCPPPLPLPPHSSPFTFSSLTFLFPYIIIISYISFTILLTPLTSFNSQHYSNCTCSNSTSTNTATTF